MNDDDRIAKEASEVIQDPELRQIAFRAIQQHLKNTARDRCPCVLQEKMVGECRDCVHHGGKTSCVHCGFMGGRWRAKGPRKSMSPK